MILPLAVGLVLGAVLILAARSLGPQRELTPFAIGLTIAALVYVGFGIVGGARLSWLALEVSGVPLFGLLAWLGMRRSAGWLALGWAAHVAWDAGLHLGSSAPAFVPQWYPVFCISFDLLVAGYLAARHKQL